LKRYNDIHIYEKQLSNVSWTWCNLSAVCHCCFNLDSYIAFSCSVRGPLSTVNSFKPPLWSIRSIRSPIVGYKGSSADADFQGLGSFVARREKSCCDVTSPALWRFDWLSVTTGDHPRRVAQRRAASRALCRRDRATGSACRARAAGGSRPRCCATRHCRRRR